MDAVFVKVQGVVADLFGIPVNEIAPNSSPETIEAWDSLQHLNLALSLEQTFGMRFSPDELERMISVGSIVALLESKLANVEASVDIADASPV